MKNERDLAEWLVYNRDYLLSELRAEIPETNRKEYILNFLVEKFIEYHPDKTEMLDEFYDSEKIELTIDAVYRKELMHEYQN
jgi:hypothetical protein